VLVAGAVSIMAMFGITGVGLAQDPAPDQELPPAFAPPVPAPVVDVDTAAAFAEGYATRNAWRYLRENPRRVRVVDANAACLAHPVIADRYGCVFTLRALVLDRRHRGWDKWGHSSKYHRRGGDHGKRDRRPRFRIRTYGCLGLATVIGGANPQGITRFVECARVPRGDVVAPEPVA
jgi:hypothetical protein